MYYGTRKQTFFVSFFANVFSGKMSLAASESHLDQMAEKEEEVSSPLVCFRLFKCLKLVHSQAIKIYFISLPAW